MSDDARSRDRRGEGRRVERGKGAKAEEGSSDRRRQDRRAAWIRLADYPLPQLRKELLTLLLLGAILALFLYMVHDVLVAAVAGVVLGIYLIPFERWLHARLRNRGVAAVVTITLVTVPLVVMLLYSWIEISRAASYLQVHREEVARQINGAIDRLPFTQGIEIEDRLTGLVGTLASQTSRLVAELRATIDIVLLGVAVLLFTTFYILTDHERIVAYLRSKVPGRYQGLVSEMSRSVRAVVYGALYAAFFTQLLKSGVILALNLAFDVPLAVVLTIVSFFIGFFPIVGSWSVYLPVAIYLMVFRHNTFGGLAMLVVGFVGNTLLLSMYLRPKIAAERSQVLNFYWMFIALVTGVYTFGLIGIIIGPVLIAVLKAIFDSIMRSPGELVPDSAGLGADGA